MTPHPLKSLLVSVALLAEGVDRNKAEVTNNALDSCRPPRGGRG